VKPSDFFDAQHADDRLPLPSGYRMLRRFEVSRADVAANLLPAGASLLDVGCGDGELLARVKDRYQRMVGTDISPSAIEQAQRRHGSIAEFVVMDASAPLPFGDASFSTVITLSTLQYVFDPAVFLAEAHRVLEPGGHLLVEVPNVAYMPQRLRLLAGLPIRTSYWRHGIDGGNLHYFTVDSIRQLLIDQGFTPKRVTGSGIFAGLRTWRVSLLCGNIFVLARK
jgi:methionine biosynthesis protein MetW